MSDQERLKEQYPESLYTKVDFTFSKSELILINTYAAIKEMGEMAKVLATNLINAVCIPRVGLSSDREIGVYYNNTEGTFTVYTPRHFCDLCKKKAGHDKYLKGYYCKTCLSLAQLKQQVLEESNHESKGNSTN